MRIEERALIPIGNSGKKFELCIESNFYCGDFMHKVFESFFHFSF